MTSFILPLLTADLVLRFVQTCLLEIAAPLAVRAPVAERDRENRTFHLHLSLHHRVVSRCAPKNGIESECDTQRPPPLHRQ
jgi:hypothetical protein